MAGSADCQRAKWRFTVLQQLQSKLPKPERTRQARLLQFLHLIFQTLTYRVREASFGAAVARANAAGSSFTKPNGEPAAKAEYADDRFAFHVFANHPRAINRRGFGQDGSLRAEGCDSGRAEKKSRH